MEQYAKYLRKSRFDRDYAELSIEETLKRHDAILEKIAREREYHIARTYYEVVSGESIAARPEIQKLLEEVSDGLYAGVLVVDLERLARGNGADQAYISQVFQFSGTKIITPQKTYDPSNEFDEEYFEFGLFMSRREYKTINRRLIRGRDSSAAEGKYTGSIPPYGYSREKLSGEKGYTLKPAPDEAENVRLIFQMFLNHTGTKSIANALNARKVPTRHGGPWDSSTVRNILSNPVYMGKIRRGWRQQVKSLENGAVVRRIRQKQDMEDYHIYEGLHPALVSEADFYAVQALRQEKKPAPRVRESLGLQNFFAGLLYCGVCGRRMGRTTASRARGSKARLRCEGGGTCPTVSADYDLVERAVIDALRAWLEGYRVRVDASDFSRDIEDWETRRSQARRELERLDAQMENACRLVEQEVYTPEIFRQRREKLDGEVAQERTALAEAEEMLERLRAGSKSQAELIPHTEALLDSYDAMTNQERNTLLKEILQRIEYRREPDGQIEIDLYPRLPKR